MKSFVAVVAGLLALSGVAQAQSTPAGLAAYEAGYVEGIAQSAFGNVTSQSFGAEGGLNFGPRMRVFVEVGRARDTSPKTLGAAAQIIGGYLTSVQSAAVTYSVKQPLSFGVAGIRYIVPYSQRVEPYVSGGVGLARVTRDVAFTVGGTDVTSTLANYGVVLGSDLSGTETKPMFTAGGGVVWKLSSPVFFDAGYRYAVALTDGGSTTVNRVGLGVGIRF